MPARPAPLRAFLWSLVLVELFSGVIQAYFLPVYPTLSARFHVSIGTLSWALTGFTLAAAVSTPLFAKLGDTYGHRKILRIEVGLVVIGSVLVAVAPDFGVLLAGRVLQGTLAAYLPLMFGLVRSRYADDETGKAVSYLTAVLVFGSLVGGVLTGLLIQYAHGPTWALWLPAAGTLIGFAGLLIARGDPAAETPPRRAGQRIDWTGAALLAIGLTAILLALTDGGSWGWVSVRTLGFLLGGVAVLAGWCVVELRVAQPLADLRYLFRPVLLPVYLAGFCVYFGGVGGQVAAATFLSAPAHVLGYGLGLTSAAIGALNIPVLCLALLATFCTARLGRAIGFRPVMLLGCVAAFAGLGGLTIWHNTFASFLVLYALASMGLGFIESASRTIVVGELREGEVAIGEGIYELTITVGAAIGSAVFGAVLSAHPSAVPGIAAQGGYELVWLIAALTGLLAVLAAALGNPRKLILRGVS